MHDLESFECNRSMVWSSFSIPAELVDQEAVRRVSGTNLPSDPQQARIRSWPPHQDGSSVRLEATGEVIAVLPSTEQRRWLTELVDVDSAAAIFIAVPAGSDLVDPRVRGGSDTGATRGLLGLMVRACRRRGWPLPMRPAAESRPGPVGSTHPNDWPAERDRIGTHVDLGQWAIDLDHVIDRVFGRSGLGEACVGRAGCEMVTSHLSRLWGVSSWLDPGILSAYDACEAIAWSDDAEERQHTEQELREQLVMLSDVNEDFFSISFLSD